MLASSNEAQGVIDSRGVDVAAYGADYGQREE